MKDAYIVHFDLTSRNQKKRREQLKEIALEYKLLAVVTLEPAFKTWNKRMSDRIKNNFLGMPLTQAFWIHILSLINQKHARSLFNSVYSEWNLFLDQTPIRERLYFNDETSQFQSKPTKRVMSAP